MARELHIIASCTDKKRTSAGEPVRLRSVRTGDLERRSEQWWERLNDKSSERLPADELYVGGHWSVARGLPEVAREQGFNAELWVASAGYGLVPAGAPLRSYSATFGSRHDDSVAGNKSGSEAREYHRGWWHALSSRRGPDSRAARSIAALAQKSPNATVMVVGSPDYISAMEADLIDARGQMNHPERLIVVSSTNRPRAAALTGNWVPSHARLLADIGYGTRISLHALTAEKILRESERWPLEASTLQARYKRLLARLPAPETFAHRQPQTDDAVRRFIKSALRSKPGTARTPLLRELRNTGHRCEQKRFQRLYEEVAASHA